MRFLAAAAICALSVASAHAQEAAGRPKPAAPKPREEVDTADIVVTANKRSELSSRVGMSIRAIGGEDLDRLGITDTTALSKVTPGLSVTSSYFGASPPVFTIRGVGFLDASLASSPTVSVYVDEAPLPFSALTQGALLDVQRVEVLKGPQGTLFGQNATGGAVNYVPNRPTDEFHAGIDASYGRFNQLDIQGFVSGPIAEGLNFRIAGRRQQMDNWQKSYTGLSGRSGQQDFWNGRAQLQFKNDRFLAILTVSGWRDQSDTQVPQFFGVATGNPVNGVDPRFAAYPVAPRDNRAADRSACINTSPFNEPFNTIPPPYGYTPERPTTPTNCASLARDNSFYGGSLRLEYDVSDSVKLTSLTSYAHFKRDQPFEGDGTIYQDYESYQTGNSSSIYQELRLGGEFGAGGHWTIGGNYQRDKALDSALTSFQGSSQVPLQLPTGPAYLGPTRPESYQATSTYAVFGNLEYPVTEQLKLHAGVRYTDSRKRLNGCNYDGGDGSWAAISQQIQNLYQLNTGYITLEQFLLGQGKGVNVGPGKCAILGPGPSFAPPSDGYVAHLNEDNISWRVGADWQAGADTLLYANVSKGYKAGSFPTTLSSSYVQYFPAKQEELLAYEAGFKSTLLDRALHLEGAVFYYDYTDKQITGAVNDALFGVLSRLVNVPKSRVLGFEMSGRIRPFAGLTLSPGVSYAHSRVRGDYFGYELFTPNPVNFKGQAFPLAPAWQANADVQYEWNLSNKVTAFIGGNVNYQSSTRSFFYNPAPDAPRPPDLLEVPARTLVDLRAGVESGPWRFQIYGRNVTDRYYYTMAFRNNDALLRYTGMPATYGVSLSYRY